MPNATSHQSSFIGGEWAPTMMGRSDNPHYRQALTVCVNNIIAEGGAICRRSGAQFLLPTYGRNPAKLLPFYSNFFAGGAGAQSVSVAYNFCCEFTTGGLRFITGTGPVMSNSSAVTANSFASNTLSVTVASGASFAVGDNVMLVSDSLSAAVFGPWINRVMSVTAKSTNDLTLKDDLGNVFGSGISSGTNDLAGADLYKIFRLGTPYVAADIQGLRMVQATDNTGTLEAFILAQSQPPYTLLSDNLVLTLTQTVFVDGPYLDQQGTFENPEGGAVSAYTGTVTFTPATSAFTADDVGRQIRLFSQPPAWNIATTYSYGDTVTYNNQWWRSIATGTYATSNVGVYPGSTATVSGVPVLVWVPAPTEGQWAWGTIATQSSTTCTIALETDLNSANGTTVSIWRLGVFKAGQYPTCGSYIEGRLLLAGAIPNRVDFSSSNDPLTFSPTDINGNVLSSNAMAEIFNSDENDPILWLTEDREGVIAGTQRGEWLIDDGGTGQGFSPMTVRSRKVTKYGVANVEPRRVGPALALVQTAGRLVFEYLADAFTGKYSGKLLNDWAKHLSTKGIVEIVYQENPVPMLWARDADGNLTACTYRRYSRFITEDPVAKGWHRQVLGGNYASLLARPVTGMCVLPSGPDVTDLLYLATTDINGANGWIEVMRPVFEAL
ncbi:MAG: hypothetical protein ACRDRB_09780 [Pseudonocardiaceae bacterium]